MGMPSMVIGKHFFKMLVGGVSGENCKAGVKMLIE